MIINISKLVNLLVTSLIIKSPSTFNTLVASIMKSMQLVPIKAKQNTPQSILSSFKFSFYISATSMKSFTDTKSKLCIFCNTILFLFLLIPSFFMCPFSYKYSYNSPVPQPKSIKILYFQLLFIIITCHLALIFLRSFNLSFKLESHSILQFILQILHDIL